MAIRLPGVLIAVSALFALPVWAQTTPPPAPRPAPPVELPAPRPLELQAPARPALAAQEGVTVAVERFTFSGNTRIGTDELTALLRPLVQRTLRFDELATAADAVTALYRRRGFLLALAYLPEQQIQGGSVEIAVLEGRLGSLQLGAVPDGIDRDFASSVALWRIDSGAVLGADNLVRNLLVLNELPGLAASADVRPGAEVGTADVSVDLRETAARTSGVVSLDNHGGSATGRVRLGAAATLRQLAGRGDVLNLQGTLSERHGLQSLQAGYSIPVHASGTRLSASISHLNYRVTDPAFAALDAKGDATDLQLSFDQPLLRRVGQTLTLRLGAVHKQLSDRIEAFAQHEDRHINALLLALRGEVQDRAADGAAPLAPTGSTRYSVSATGGRVGFDDAVAEAADAVQRRTAGKYGRVNVDLAREQPFAERYALIARLAVQSAVHRNLDNAERAVLGGANSLRDVGVLTTLADRAELAAVELHQRLSFGSVALDNAVFLDLGHGRADRLAATPGDVLRSRLLGISTEAALPFEFTLRLAATRQTIEPPPADSPRWVTRGWLELVKAF